MMIQWSVYSAQEKAVKKRGVDVNIQKIKTEMLNPATYNPRKDLKSGDKEYEKLKRSIAEFGYVEPVIWNKTTGNVVGGHQRLKVLMDLGQLEIDCVVVELDLQKEKALNIALNKIQGEWDETKLAELMADLDADAFDVSFTGFDASEVDALLNKFYTKEAVQDEFDIDKEKSEIEKKGTITQTGDIWQLGNHRLMCGGSANLNDLEKLMNGSHAQMAITAPPDMLGKEYKESGIEPWLAVMKPIIKNICKHTEIICWQMADLYNTDSQFIEPTGFYSVQMFADRGFRPIWIRIWRKQGIKSSSKKQYEYVTAFVGQETAEYNDQEYVWLSAFASHSYKFVKRLTKDERKNWGYSGIWDMATVKEIKNHPAMFPVELPWRCIKMHSDIGGIVLEPFSGVGTTIIAAEQTERKCYAMDQSPIYCDLAIKRWEDFTGEKATRLEATQ